MLSRPKYFKVLLAVVVRLFKCSVSNHSPLISEALSVAYHKAFILNLPPIYFKTILPLLGTLVRIMLQISNL